MSLKGFHFLFIIVSLLLSAWFTGFEVRSFFVYGQTQDLILAGFGAVGFVSLMMYFAKVKKQYKDISYM